MAKLTYTQARLAREKQVTTQTLRNWEKKGDLESHGITRMENGEYVLTKDIDESLMSPSEVALQYKILQNENLDQKLEKTINFQYKMHLEIIKEQLINPLLQQIRIAITKCNLTTEQIDTFNKFMPDFPGCGTNVGNNSLQP